MRLSQGRLQGKRCVLLTCDENETTQVLRLVRQYVLEPGTFPNMQSKGGRTRLVFAPRYLDALLLTFPHVRLGEKLAHRLAVNDLESYVGLPAPDVDIPGLRKELMDHQKVAVALGYNHLQPGWYLNDSMGTGKTAVALAMMLKADVWPVLVLCPSGVKYTWQREGAKFTDLNFTILDGTQAQRYRQLNEPADVYVVNSEALRWKGRSTDSAAECSAHPQLYERTWPMLVADEYHHYRHPTAQQSKGFLNLKDLCERKLFMSGTPLLKRPGDLWAPLHFVWPEKFRSQWAFDKKLEIRQGRKVIGYNPTEMRRLKRFIHRPERSLRRRYSQISNDLPDRMPDTILTCELTGEQKRLYNQILTDFKLALADGTVYDIRGTLPHIMRLKQASFSPELYGGSATSKKIDLLKEVVDDVRSNNAKVLVFSQWSKATRIIQRELAEHCPAYVDGTVPYRLREEEIDRFNNDPECGAFVGTIRSCREGISLGAASYVVFTDRDWSPAVNEQAVARSAAGGLRGIGQSAPVYVINLYAEGTIEASIEALLQRKQLVNAALVEEDGAPMVTASVTLDDIRQLVGLA